MPPSRQLTLAGVRYIALESQSHPNFLKSQTQNFGSFFRTNKWGQPEEKRAWGL